MSRAVAPIVRRSFTANSEETGSLPAWWSATVTIVTAPVSHLTHPSRVLLPPLPAALWPAQLAIALAAGSLLVTPGLWLVPCHAGICRQRPEVNAHALSIPDRQAVPAQNAHIDGVTGATSWPASVRMLRCSSIRTAPPP
jgi:hypothetical protein